MRLRRAERLSLEIRLRLVSSPPQLTPASQGIALPSGRRWHLRLAVVRGVVGMVPSCTFNRTRLLALKACGVHIGHATLFLGLPQLRGPGSIVSRLHIGAYCGFNDGCLFDLNASVTIGDHVAVGHEARFLTTITQAGVQVAAPITVGDGVWLGARCTIMGGVTVGAGSVIGAGVTVSADIPPNMLITGAKPVSLARWR
jgi:maltose O-acetyltransferase